MADVNPQTATEQSDGGRDRRGARQPAAGDRLAEERSFAGERTADRKPADAQKQAADVGVEVPHEAAQAGQEMIRMSQRAAAQTSELWRQSLEPFAAWQSEMKRWFDQAWGQTTGLGAMRPLQTARPFAGGPLVALLGAPAADLKENDDGYRLCIEVPGMEPADIKLDMRDGHLVVSGHKAEERHDGGGAYRISERRYGSFERVFPLPASVDRGAIDAKLENGLLKINLPKGPSAAGNGSKIQVHA